MRTENSLHSHRLFPSFGAIIKLAKLCIVFVQLDEALGRTVKGYNRRSHLLHNISFILRKNVTLILV
ncbi:hypothetical protein Mapa_013051 [Marchantia paleacea]|nr:hypothetical protein Mapa_013051 [Marchantia paleacea]